MSRGNVDNFLCPFSWFCHNVRGRLRDGTIPHTGFMDIVLTLYPHLFPLTYTKYGPVNTKNPTFSLLALSGRPLFYIYLFPSKLLYVQNNRRGVNEVNL